MAKNKHLLHLEDDGPLRDIFRMFLKNSAPDTELHQFVNSDHALEYTRDNVDKIRVYILDIRVPGSMDGLEFALRIRELGSQRPIVITSAYRKPPAEELKAFDGIWVPKPSHILNMMQKIMPLMEDEPESRDKG
jgi:DNA-binding NtrC family response regulator